MIKNKKSLQRERSWSTSSNKLERNVSTIANSTAHVSDVSIKGDSENEELEGAVDGECKKDGDISSCNSNFRKASFSCNPRDNLLNCLLYWQENIHPNNYKC